MTDFYDWLTAADTGLTADRLAESFRLSHEELRRATEALAPAFTEALRRAMTDPGAMTALAASFAPFADPRAFGLGESRPGDAAWSLAAQLLGPPERTASLARRASLASGIAPDTMQRLMASLSVLTMETVTRMLLANIARHQPALPDMSGYGAAMAESLRRGANAVEALNRPSQDFGTRKPPAPMGGIDLQALFRDALTGRLPWLPPMAEPSAPAQRPASAAAPGGAVPGSGTGQTGAGFDPFLPFAAMMAAFARGMGAAAAQLPASQTPPMAPAPDVSEAPPAPRAEPTNGGTPAGSADHGFSALWESGRRMQDDYISEMTALFSRYHPVPREGGEGGGQAS